jgi:hypothetical protein
MQVAAKSACDTVAALCESVDCILPFVGCKFQPSDYIEA